MAILYGWAVPTLFGAADHTYVTSSDNNIWSCWGKNSGGQIICSDEGSSRLADCISQRNSFAGIIYGMNGICHQAANRILWPAGITVCKARMYRVSVFIYGTYGARNLPFLLEWNMRKNYCLRASGVTKIHPGPSRLMGENDTDKEYLKRLDEIYYKALKRNDYRANLLEEELKLAIEYHIGTNANISLTDVLCKLQSEMLEEKQFFDEALAHKSINAFQYTVGVNKLIGDTLWEAGKILGFNNYEKFFGASPGVDPVLINPEIMARVYK